MGCETIRPAPENMVSKNDHAGLANYYKNQANELTEKAKSWDMLAESYERHGDPHGKVEPKDHAAHCKSVANAYRQAAGEADALAREHRNQIPHGMLQ
jgi:predicted Zn-dependent protease